MNNTGRKLFIKRLTFTMLIFLALFPLGLFQKQANPALAQATDPPSQGQSGVDQRWLAEWKATIQQDSLYLFAVASFNSPVKWDGKVTDIFEDNRFGVIRFSFRGGGTYTVETFPPESSRVELRIPNGFSNGIQARAELMRYIQDIGVKMDWSKSQISISNGEQCRTFSAFEADLNAFATIVYKNGKLIEIGFSLAL